MVTVSNGELKVAYEAMQQMVGELATQKVSPRLMMRLRRMIRAAKQTIEDVEAERQRLLKQYGKMDENGKLVSDPKTQAVVFETPEQEQEFRAEFGKLLEETSEQPEQLTEMDLEGVTFTGEIVFRLGALLEG